MDDKFEQWLRDSIPERTEDRFRSEAQLAVLKERVRTRKSRIRKRRARIGMIAAPVLLLVFVSASFVDLGGDDFELEGLGSSGDHGDMYKNIFRGTGFSVQDLKSEEEIQEFNQQLAAGEGVNIGLEGWKIKGITKWTIIKEYDVFGKMVETGSPPQSLPSEYPPGFLDFIQNHWDKFKSKINSGEIPPAEKITLEFDGANFTVQYWKIFTKQFGSVTYYRGVPCH